MKIRLSRLLFMVVSLFIVVFLTSCRSNISNKNINTSTNSNNSAIDSKGSNVNNNTFENVKEHISSTSTKNNNNNLKPLDEKDFIATDGIDTLSLDVPYKDFKISKQEIAQENNFVGDFTSGGYVYKYYSHKYDDFAIYISNANYNFKNRSMDDRYITQITLKNSNFKTIRGIAVGQTLSDIANAYGNGKITINEDTTTLVYSYKDMGLTFTLDKGNKVTSIILNIFINNGN